MDVLDPIPSCIGGPVTPLAPRPRDLRGLRLGVLDNSKGNADHLLNFIVEGVKQEFKVDSVVVRRKPASSAGATPQVLDELAKEADLVVSAMAD